MNKRRVYIGVGPANPENGQSHFIEVLCSKDVEQLLLHFILSHLTTLQQMNEVILWPKSEEDPEKN